MRRRSERIWLTQVIIIGVGIVATLAATLVLDTGPAWSQLPASALASLPPCDGEEVLTWVNENGDTIDPVGTTALYWNATLIACPWSPGTLTVTLRGTTAAGIGTRAVLTQGAERLLDVELRDEERTFEVDVPASGQLLLAFVNDYYDPPEDRNLWVSGLAFTPRAP
jgi:hypothetical protein